MDVAAKLAQAGYQALVASPRAIPLTFLEILAWCTALLFSGESLHGGVEPFWEAVLSVVASGPDEWLRQCKARRCSLHINDWLSHEPSAGLALLAVNAVLSPPHALRADCPAAWSLALLLKLEVDLSELQAGGAAKLEEGRLGELEELWTGRAKASTGAAVCRSASVRGDTHAWFEALVGVAEERVANLFERSQRLATVNPTGLPHTREGLEDEEESHLSRWKLSQELSDTWLGLDRLPAALEGGIGPEPAAGMEPPEQPLPAGAASCDSRTAAMRLLERSSGNAPGHFWHRMSETYAAFFSWRLAALGVGERRALLWKGTALVERNISFAWRHCWPAAAAAVLFRAERWFARMTQAVIWGSTSPDELALPAGTMMLDLALKHIQLYQKLQPRLRPLQVPDAWARALHAAEGRLGDRLRTVSAVSALPAEGLGEIRRHIERYLCHASVGLGVLPLLVASPGAAGALARAGRLVARARERRRPRERLAFLFMVYDRLNFPRLWHRFFAGAAPGSYRLFLHASRPPAEGDSSGAAGGGPSPSASFFERFRVPSLPSAWFNISLVLFSLLGAALQDPSVSKAMLLSQDSVPLASFSHIHRWARADPGRSWLCMDHEYTRSEPWVLYARRHMKALVRHREHVAALAQGVGMCDAEEMGPQALYLLGEGRRMRDRCVMFTQWALPKYFAVGRPAPLGRPEPLVGEFVRQIGACGHPSTFHELARGKVLRLMRAARHDRFWFARKFVRNASVVGGAAGPEPLEDFLIARLFGEVEGKST